MKASKLRFGDFELDTGELTLSHYGQRIRLERKPLELLILLAQKPGQLAVREEIIEALWGKIVYFDAENGLNNAIRKIRVALRDTAASPLYLETVVGRGYRFIAPVEEVASETDGPTAEKASFPDEAAQSSAVPLTRNRRWVAVAALSVAAAAGLSGYLLWRHSMRGPRIRSLAVLPLNNLSGSPDQEYFVDGMTDALITDLAQIANLKVISRTSSMQYKGAHQPLGEIARSLHVDAVIEGSAVRSGDTVRITAQLIDARSDEHLWAESFEGTADNMVSLQDRIAYAIARNVEAKVGSGVQLRHPAPRALNANAYQDYLRGRYFFDKREPESATKSVEYFQKAIAEDPNFAPAYAGLAEALPARNWFANRGPVEVMTEAEQAARKALALDDSLGEAHTALGGLLGLFDWNWPAAEIELRRGIELSPSNSLAHERYAMWLQSVGRLEEALEEARRAQELDPVSFFMNRELGRSLYLARHYDEALEQLKKSAEMQPYSDVVWNFVGDIYEKQGKRDEVLRLTAEGKTNRDLSPEARAALQSAYRRSGWNGFWEEWLRRHTEQNESEQEPYGMAQAEARLGHAEKAWAWMEKSADKREVWVTWVMVDPVFDDIRSSPGYQKLLRRIQLTK